MFQFIIGVIVGIIVCSVGVRGLVDAADRAVDQTKSVAQEVIKGQ